MIPTEHELEPCPRGCGQPVLWTLTERGRQMAVDGQPHELGNQAVFKDGTGRWRSRSLDGATARRLDPWEHRFKPHVATCTRPHAQPALPGLAPRRIRPRIPERSRRR